ncbi:hypothetical protein E2C01_075650 [Portunus trituberculatus]|uniref:Uncharacterized protein n=1 Tax=Portunus trituberculatus TaxID=210409 RepID=A0A5B7I951_PORTR|nr:hypothetical protein [Portunus trituberculatus]
MAQAQAQAHAEAVEAEARKRKRWKDDEREITQAQAHAEAVEAVVQWNHACFGVRGVSKRTGSDPVHGQSVGWASSLGATVS